MRYALMVSWMLLRMSRLPSRMLRAPRLESLTPTMTRYCSLLGGMGRLAKVYWGNL